MSAKLTSPQKDTDCIESLTDIERRSLSRRAGRAVPGASYIGTDLEGRFHFFSMVRRTVVVFESLDDTGPNTHNLRALPLDDSPRAWAEYVAQHHCAWADLRLSKPVSDALEVDR